MEKVACNVFGPIVLIYSMPVLISYHSFGNLPLSALGIRLTPLTGLL